MSEVANRIIESPEPRPVLPMTPCMSCWKDIPAEQAVYSHSEPWYDGLFPFFYCPACWPEVQVWQFATITIITE